MTSRPENPPCSDDVDFVCIGAQKSGTTFIASAFHAHPQIQLPDSKELHFFSAKGEYKTEGGFAQCNADRDVAWYRQQFVADSRKKGEISTHYIYDPESARRIRDAFPNIKVFTVLRSPADRAFSQYNMERHKTGKETRSLMQIIRDEPDNEILARGLYARQLAPYVHEFPSDQLRVYLFEEMTADPVAFFRDVYDFIGIDNSVVPHGLDKRMNPSRRTRFMFIPRTIRMIRKALEAIGLRSLVRGLIQFGVGRRLREFNNRYNQVVVDFTMSAEERSALHRYFEEDIEELGRLLNRDLSIWKRSQ